MSTEKRTPEGEVSKGLLFRLPNRMKKQISDLSLLSLLQLDSRSEPRATVVFDDRRRHTMVFLTEQGEIMYRDGIKSIQDGGEVEYHHSTLPNEPGTYFTQLASYGDPEEAIASGGARPLHGTRLLALRNDGMIKAYSHSQFRQEGKRERTFLPVTLPDHVERFQGNFHAISTGKWHCLGLLKDGSVVGWGANHLGQAPRLMEGPFASIAAGHVHGIGLLRNGRVRCWGSNIVGQARDLDGSYAAVAAGANDSLALRKDGRLEFFGLSVARAHFYMGDLAEQPLFSLMPSTADTNQYRHLLAPSDAGYVAIAARGTLFAALHRDGTIDLWGMSSGRIPGAREGERGRQNLAPTSGSVFSRFNVIQGWDDNDNNVWTTETGFGMAGVELSDS